MYVYTSVNKYIGQTYMYIQRLLLLTLASRLGCYGHDPGPAFDYMPLRTHNQIWPRVQLYAGCSPLASLAQRVSYRIIALVRQSLLALLPVSFRDLCCTTSSASGLRSLRSTKHSVLVIPLNRTTKQNCSFSEVDPSLWNGLQMSLRLFSRVHSDTFTVTSKLLYSCIRETRDRSIEVTLQWRHKNFHNK